MSEVRQGIATTGTGAWRRWLILGTLGVGMAMIAVLRSSSFVGVNVSVVGENATYRLSAWWLAILAAPATLMLLIGFAIATLPSLLARCLGGIALLAGLSIAVIGASSILVGGLVVTPEGFTHTAGFWWSPDVRSVRFDDLTALWVVPEPTDDGRPSFVLECVGRDDEVVEIPKSTVLEVGLRRILLYATRRGVDVLADGD